MLFIRYRFTKNKNSHTYQIVPSTNTQLSSEVIREVLARLSILSHDKSSIRFIIDSSYDKGIRLLFSASDQNADTFKKILIELDPELDILILDHSIEHKKKINYHLYQHFSYPLNIKMSVGVDDPLHKVMIEMSKLKKNESCELEINFTPSNSLLARHIRNQIIAGKKPKIFPYSIRGTLTRIVWLSVSIVFKTISYLLNLISVLLNDHKDLNKFDFNNQRQNFKIDNPKIISQLDKLYEPLYRATLKLSTSTSGISRTKEINKALDIGLSGYSLNTSQKLKACNNRFCLSNMFWPRDVLCAGEIASLFHLPSSKDISSLVKLNKFKSLPIDRSLMDLVLKDNESLLIGENSYQGINSEIKLLAESRKRHTYITGATGSGKSNLLNSMILQDIAEGRGITLIDPHGDLAESLISQIPDNRKNDVVYFKPSDLNYPIGINLIEAKSYPGSKGYKMEIERISEGLVSIFKKLFNEEVASGHRIEYIIRNCTRTALLIDGATIFTIYRLLTDTKFRNKVIPTIKDKDLKNFWANELGKAGDFQRVKMSLGVTSKIGRMLFSEPTKRVFGQSKSTIEFSDIIDNKKILICNISKGDLGEASSELFGIVLLTKLQIATLQRSMLPETDRIDHYIFVDEFQNFATSSFVQMLAESRKYSVYLTMAEQSPSQQDSAMTNIILANIGNLICFRTPASEDQKILINFFRPALSYGDLINMPNYHFYIKSVLPNAAGVVIASGRTIAYEDNNDSSIYSRIIENSRHNYSLDVSKLSSLDVGPKQLNLL